jgi:hypothetical protein
MCFACAVAGCLTSEVGREHATDALRVVPGCEPICLRPSAREMA